MSVFCLLLYVQYAFVLYVFGLPHDVYRYANEREDYPVSVGFVQYLRLLLGMTAAPECEGFIQPHSMTALRDIVEAMSDLMGIEADSSPTVAMTTSAYDGALTQSQKILCVDRDLLAFIDAEGYTLHNCHQ